MGIKGAMTVVRAANAAPDSGVILAKFSTPADALAFCKNVLRPAPATPYARRKGRTPLAVPSQPVFIDATNLHAAGARTLALSAAAKRLGFDVHVVLDHPTMRPEAKRQTLQQRTDAQARRRGQPPSPMPPDLSQYVRAGVAQGQAIIAEDEADTAIAKLARSDSLKGRAGVVFSSDTDFLANSIAADLRFIVMPERAGGQEEGGAGARWQVLDREELNKSPLWPFVELDHAALVALLNGQDYCPKGAEGMQLRTLVKEEVLWKHTGPGAPAQCLQAAASHRPRPVTIGAGLEAGFAVLTGRPYTTFDKSTLQPSQPSMNPVLSTSKRQVQGANIELPLPPLQSRLDDAKAARQKAKADRESETLEATAERKKRDDSRSADLWSSYVLREREEWPELLPAVYEGAPRSRPLALAISKRPVKGATKRVVRAKAAAEKKARADEAKQAKAEDSGDESDTEEDTRSTRLDHCYKQSSNLRSDRVVLPEAVHLHQGLRYVNLAMLVALPSLERFFSIYCRRSLKATAECDCSADFLDPNWGDKVLCAGAAVLVNPLPSATPLAPKEEEDLKHALRNHPHTLAHLPSDPATRAQFLRLANCKAQKGAKPIARVNHCVLMAALETLRDGFPPLPALPPTLWADSGHQMASNLDNRVMMTADDSLRKHCLKLVVDELEGKWLPAWSRGPTTTYANLARLLSTHSAKEALSNEIYETLRALPLVAEYDDSPKLDISILRAISTDVDTRLRPSALGKELDKLVVADRNGVDFLVERLASLVEAEVVRWRPLVLVDERALLYHESSFSKILQSRPNALLRIFHRTQSSAGKAVATRFRPDFLSYSPRARSVVWQPGAEAVLTAAEFLRVVAPDAPAACNLRSVIPPLETGLDPVFVAAFDLEVQALWAAFGGGGKLSGHLVAALAGCFTAATYDCSSLPSGHIPGAEIRIDGTSISLQSFDTRRIFLEGTLQSSLPPSTSARDVCRHVLLNRHRPNIRERVQELELSPRVRVWDLVGNAQVSFVDNKSLLRQEKTVGGLPTSVRRATDAQWEEFRQQCASAAGCILASLDPGWTFVYGLNIRELGTFAQAADRQHLLRPSLLSEPSRAHARLERRTFEQAVQGGATYLDRDSMEAEKEWVDESNPLAVHRANQAVRNARILRRARATASDLRRCLRRETQKLRDKVVARFFKLVGAGKRGKAGTVPVWVAIGEGGGKPAYGVHHADFQNSIMKEIIKAARAQDLDVTFILVDEFDSTSTCPHPLCTHVHSALCQGDEAGCTKSTETPSRVEYSSFIGSKKKHYRIAQCPECVSTTHKDRHAAYKIGYIFNHQAHYNGRHPHRPGPRPPASSNSNKE